MSSRRNSLSPPERKGTNDPGARELGDTSDSDEHFSDAQSGPASSRRQSPIPRTRVEKISDEPSYGEVPGTEAYRKREGDAEPDEIAVIPEDKDDSAWSEERGRSPVDRPATPGGHPIPKTVVEETADTAGSVTHPEIEKKHRADPPPDLILKADGTMVEEGGGAVPDTPSSANLPSPNSTRARRKPSVAYQKSALSPSTPGPRSAGFNGGDDEFGDDFDDFEEGDEDGDFGDFDDGFQEAETQPTPAHPPPQAAVPPRTLSFPIPDFDDLDPDEILAATEPYLNALYSTAADDTPSLPPLSKDNPIFLTPRSASLWSQLVAPPPLQPPDWIRSRIRRLFLVSLGVPVDLDEILPASKQKKLVLPSLHHVNSSGSLRTSTDSRSVSRLRQGDANASTTSLDSQGQVRPAGTAGASSSSKQRRKGPPPVPELDLVAARQLCTTTDEALGGMTDAELREHVAKLEAMDGAAKEVLEHWKKRTDEQIAEREAFEGVIENLVKHARKVRK